MLTRYGHIEKIPLAPGQWDVPVRGASKLTSALASRFDDALLYRRLATLERDAPTVTSVDELRWRGPTPELAALARRIDAEPQLRRAERLAAKRA